MEGVSHIYNLLPHERELYRLLYVKGFVCASACVHMCFACVCECARPCICSERWDEKVKAVPSVLSAKCCDEVCNKTNILLCRVKKNKYMQTHEQ